MFRTLFFEINFKAVPKDLLGTNGIPPKLTAEFNSSNNKWHKYPIPTERLNNSLRLTDSI